MYFTDDHDENLGISNDGTKMVLIDFGEETWS